MNWLDQSLPVFIWPLIPWGLNHRLAGHTIQLRLRTTASTSFWGCLNCRFYWSEPYNGEMERERERDRDQVLHQGKRGFRRGTLALQNLQLLTNSETPSSQIPSQRPHSLRSESVPSIHKHGPSLRQSGHRAPPTPQNPPTDPTVPSSSLAVWV